MKKKFLTIAIIGIVLLAAVFATTAYKGYIFKKNCSAYLKLAADAPTIERARDFTALALQYIESKNLTKGNTAVFFPTPTTNLELWYGQIKTAYINIVTLIEQEKINPGSVSQLTKDNVLMKLREVLIDNGDKGVEITVPSNITVYPNQYLFFIWWLIASIPTFGGWIGYLILTKKNKRI